MFSETHGPRRLAARGRRLVLVGALTAALAAAAQLPASAGATQVKLRVEGTASTLYNGTVETGARAVPGGADSAHCRANATANAFAGPNALTALADAVGDANMSTSGTYFSWGVQLCSVFGEDTPATGGWLLKIDERNVTAPAGYVTVTDPLAAGDSVLLYRVTSFSEFSGSLELGIPATAAPGQAVAAHVDLYADADDSRSDAAGVTVSGGGASGTTGAGGDATLVFPASGRFLVTATKGGAVRGSAWISVDAATPAPAVVHPNRFVKCNRTYARHSRRHRRCVRIVRAKQQAARRA